MNTVIIDWKKLKTIVPYSRQHIARLEIENRFPSRVRLGSHRIGWVEKEVEQWLQARILERDEHTP